METYPIIIDGELAGRLRVERQGPRTIFEAECAMREGLLRISVYGGEREGYLGLLAPEDGKLRLRRALSRSELKSFPEEIERVERAGLPVVPPSDAHREPEETGVPDGPEPEGPSAVDAPPADRGDPARLTTEHDLPAEHDEPTRGWYASPDGALLRRGEDGDWLALPLGDARIPKDRPGERKEIEGKEYEVYQVTSLELGVRS